MNELDLMPELRPFVEIRNRTYRLYRYKGSKDWSQAESDRWYLVKVIERMLFYLQIDNDSAEKK